MSFRRHLLLLAALFLALGLGAMGGAEPFRPRSDAEPPPALTPRGRLEVRRSLVVKAVDRVRGAVVNIHSERTVHGPASAEMFNLGPSQNRINGMGTGIVIDPRGYIVTNQHVVEDVSVLRIRLADGTTTTATVLARSQEVDLALLKIDVKSPLPTIPLGSAQDLMVGETVLAIGNAYGYEHTVSLGIVSAIKRDVSLNKEISYRALIQTDAAINPGNSGGPLVNIHGDLVGVNVAIRAGAQGIGFAIPVDTMIRVAAELLRQRRLPTASDGLQVHDHIELTAEGAQRTVKIDRIEPGSAAETAGLKKDDVLVKVADVPILCSYDLERALLDRQPNDSVPVVLRRGTKDFSATLVLKAGTPIKPGVSDIVWRKLGLRLQPINSDTVAQVNRQLNGGLEVLAVQPDSVAARAGIRRGDILVGLHQWETLSLDNVSFVLSHPDLASFTPLSFYIIRNGQVRKGWLQQVD